MTRTPPTCRLVLDLSGVPWADDCQTAEHMLLTCPGVTRATVEPGTRRAVILHDSRLSLPQVWNWLIDCGAHCAGQSVPHHDCSAPPVAAKR